MKCIGISSKPGDKLATELASELSSWLSLRGCRVLVNEETADVIGCEGQPLEQLASTVELMVVLGGDGTLLYVARHFIGSSTPILGINLGRLGFLTEMPIGSMFDAVDEVLEGHLKTKHLYSLHAEIWRGETMLSSGHAINDVVMQRRAHPRMIGFEMFSRSQLVFRMRGDGLVLATPAGSTAYALSAGGPILHPEVDAISVVPVCPHTLSNRPIIVPADDVIELRLIESPLPASLNLDGQEHMVVNEGDRVLIRKGGMVSLVYLPGRHYYDVLRSKLNWAGQVEKDT
jgi:NAD+ kinase